MKLIEPRNTILPGGRDYYHEVDRSSDKLIITMGDSWTWGDRLGKTTIEYDDREHRTRHIYGNIVSEQLGADFINIGFPGWNNIYIMNRLLDIFPTLTRKYKKCYIIFPLTESGRELKNGFYNQKDHYNEIRGELWPKHHEIISNTASPSSIEYARNEMIENKIEFFYHYDLMLELAKSKSVDDFFIRYERWTFKTIEEKFNQLPGTVEWVLAKNFTSIRKENLSIIPESNLITTRWTDVIGTKGNLDPYPPDVDVLSMMGLDPILKLSSVLSLDKFKKDWINVFDQSVAAMAWLVNSPYNSQIATRHPLEQGHAWWAEFLLERLE